MARYRRLDEYVRDHSDGPLAVDLSGSGPGPIVGTGTVSTGLGVKIANPLFNVPSLSFQGANFTANNAPLSVLTNQVYDVTMNVQVIASADGVATIAELASASVDPIITIDTTNLTPDQAAQYQLFFSDGVGNGSAVTPLPAALPLFAGGLGALGLLGWRRKRKAQAA
jgi:hypothetical protein